MKVDNSTLIITDFGDIDLERLYNDTKNMIFRGVISDSIRSIFNDWMNQCGFDERQQLLVLSTVFPARVFLSLIEHWKIN